MRGDDELGVPGPAHVPEDGEQLELCLRRERGFGFVEEVQSPDPVPTPEVRHERLAVRLGDERLSAEVVEHLRIVDRPLVEQLRKVLEGLGSEERSRHAAIGPCRGDHPVELFLVGIALVAGARDLAPDVDAARPAEGGQQGRFP